MGLLKKRIIGLDILRILSMCGIIGLHVINQGGLINNTSMSSIRYYVILILLIVFYVSVDIFGILSGYLNIDKEKNKNSRIVELIFILLFWGIIIPSIFYIFNISNVRSLSVMETITNFFPSYAGRYWYIECYILLFFMMPYINHFCKKIDKEIFKKLLITLFVLLSIIPTLFINTDFFRVLNGYSPFWLIYCYMIGAYIKMYGINIEKKKIILYISLLFLVTFALNTGIRVLANNYPDMMLKDIWMIGYISPSVIVISILLVLVFEKITFNNKLNKIIIHLSAMTFSVYIIHCHKTIFDYILLDAFVPLLRYNSIIMVIGMIASIIGIYLICCILDEFRILIFKFFKVNTLIEKIGKKLDKRLNFNK